MAFKSGENVGPYRILMQLGQGGMATVYKAYHAALDRYVAIKVLHPVFMEDDSFLARFRREAQVVARLDHPHIVPVYDYAEHEGQPYLVMKFIEGETLKARMTRSPLSAAEILSVVEAVGSALGYAHREGILHRDIKPSNVILATNGHIYLTDFGLARIAESGASTLTSDRILGTPQYISPEQAIGKADLDAGTDIYSFGVMLYEMVVGRVPFSADTPFSIIHDHIYTSLPLPREVNPNVPEAVERVLLKALAKDRSDRFETVEEMVTAFRRAWEAVASAPTAGWPAAPSPVETVPAAPPPPSIPPQPVVAPTAPAMPGTAVAASGRNIPWGWVTAGVLLVVLLVFGGVAFGRWIGQSSSPVVVVMPTDMPHMTAPVTQPGAAMTMEPEPGAGHGGEMHGPQGWQLPPEVLSASPDVRDAWNDVVTYPDDPWSYQRLAETLSYAGYYDLSVEAIVQMLDVTAPDPDTLRELSRTAYYNGMLLEAAVMYQSLLDQGVALPPDERDMMEESLYVSGMYPETPQYLDWGLWYDYDPLLAQVAEARTSYFSYMNTDEVLQALDEVLAAAPDYPPALIFQAEIYLMEGDEATAQAILDQVAAQDLPEWMQLEIEFLRSLPAEE